MRKGSCNVMTRFGLERLGSVEAFHDADLGWCLRGWAGLGRSGEHSMQSITAADPSLGDVTLLTTPTLLKNEGYRVVGDWHLDGDTHTAWVNVAPGGTSAGKALPIEVVDGILEAESRWAREGVGREAPNGLVT